MIAQLNKNKYFYFLVLLFFVAEIIVFPIGDYPLNDDWTYGKSVLIYKNEGRIDVGDFAAMSLFSHIIWGFLFTKVFWFSFTILRFSTLISSFIGILFLNKLVFRITENKTIAFVSCLVLLLNPLYFNLTNTFMTDVNFNTVLILSCYFAYDFLKTENKISFILVFVFSAILVLIRQFGIIVPVCFMASCLFVKEKKWFYSGLSLLLTVIVFAVFKYYESYLREHLEPNSAYKFSSDSQITSFAFWNNLRNNLMVRYAQIFLHILVYTSPLILIYFVQIIKKFNVFITLFVFAVTAAFVYYLFKEIPFPIGNIFTNSALGAETFYETLFPELKAPHEHTFSERFEEQATMIKYILCTITLSLLILVGIDGIRKKTNPLKAEPAVLFLIAILSTYILMILITESYYDRYHIPIITVVLILMSFLPDKKDLNYAGTTVILMLMFYISVFGTKDYLELNRKRWEAYTYLKEVKKVDPREINGGFEVNCWNEGKRSWWYDFLDLKKYNYLIQYRKEPEFEILKEYEFQRYFPYKKDKIYIFVRQEKK